MEDEEFLPPYVTAEEVDFETDLETAAMVLSAASSVVVILAYAGYLKEK